MRLDTHLTQRLEQRMILAPRMIHSMEILQLPLLALQERIEQELQENPVLELKEEQPEENAPPNDDMDDKPGEPASDLADGAELTKELIIDDKGDHVDDFDRLVALNEDWANHFNDEHRFSGNRVDEEAD